MDGLQCILIAYLVTLHSMLFKFFKFQLELNFTPADKHFIKRSGQELFFVLCGAPVLSAFTTNSHQAGLHRILDELTTQADDGYSRQFRSCSPL